MEELKNRSDYSKAMMDDGIVVLEGVTQTCPNCKAIAPFLDELRKKYDNVRFYKYDVDAAEDIAQELGARQVPTFSIFKDGMIEDGVTGAKKEELERILKKVYEGK